MKVYLPDEVKSRGQFRIKINTKRKMIKVIWNFQSHHLQDRKEKKILEKHRKCERTRSVCESDTGRKLNLAGGRREDNEPQVRRNKTQVEHNQTEDTPGKQTTNGSQHSQLDRTHQSFKAILRSHPLPVFMHPCICGNQHLGKCKV